MKFLVSLLFFCLLLFRLDASSSTDCIFHLAALTSPKLQKGGYVLLIQEPDILKKGACYELVDGDPPAVFEMIKILHVSPSGFRFSGVDMEGRHRSFFQDLKADATWIFREIHE